jgi:hypothetical protein
MARLVHLDGLDALPGRGAIGCLQRDRGNARLIPGLVDEDEFRTCSDQLPLDLSVPSCWPVAPPRKAVVTRSTVKHS